MLPSNFRCLSKLTASTTVTIPSRRIELSNASSTHKSFAIGPGSAIPVVSNIMQSTGRCSTTRSKVEIVAPRTVQHTQPLGRSSKFSLKSSVSVSKVPSLKVWSIFCEFSPTSFIITAIFKPLLFLRMCFIIVDFPDPKAPVNIVTPTFCNIIQN
eukprot:NODE_391_length_9459_cov_0.222970.p5 type:complete len:155 gc:universal NODE_391_length_9459_cov_0.222970:8821-9285(+)